MPNAGRRSAMPRGALRAPPGVRQPPAGAIPRPPTRSAPAIGKSSAPVHFFATAHIPPLSAARARALGLPINGASALRSAPIGLHQARRSPCRRPLGPRSARHRLVTGPRRTAQGPPDPHPAPPLSSRPSPCARETLCRACESTGFGFWGLGLPGQARGRRKRSGAPGSRIGRWAPPGRGDPKWKLSVCSDETEALAGSPARAATMDLTRADEAGAPASRTRTPSATSGPPSAATASATPPPDRCAPTGSRVPPRHVV